MDQPERRQSGNRRSDADRRVGGAAAPAEGDRRHDGDKRKKERRVRCVYCGQAYVERGTHERVCMCRMKALHSPGG